VAELSLLLAKGLRLPVAEQKMIHIGGHLHDIGKIGIPDSILNKPGKLTEAEFAMIRQHPVVGDTIVGKVKVFHSITNIVRHHHERFDGKGYPDGLRGEEISLGARIVAVADAFDAMTSIRTYRSKLSLRDAIEETKRCRGSQFDPNIVDTLTILADKNELMMAQVSNSRTG
jgi:HD-GYP domain-containing protein (c-di-GMP phosphodiesterase class II)